MYATRPLIRRSSKVRFNVNVDVVEVQLFTSMVPQNELWWGDEEFQKSKKECVKELVEIFRCNPAIKSGKQAMQYFMLTID